MMFPSHLLGTILLGLLLSRVKPFSPRDWMIAVGFGVAIDLDHLLQLPRYVQANGLAALHPANVGQLMAYGSSWQGFMHTPVALLVVAAASIALWSALPLVFWGLHMFQDFVIATRFVRFGSATEWAVVAALLGLVLALLWADHRRLDAPRLAFRHHAAARLGLAAFFEP